jgi:hypothetical protein
VKAPKLGTVYLSIMPDLSGLKRAVERAIRHEMADRRRAAAVYYVAHCRPAPWSRRRKPLIHNGSKP